MPEEKDLRREFYEWIINKTVTSFLRSYCSEIKEINEDHIVAIYVQKHVTSPNNYCYSAKIITTNGIIEAIITKDKIFVQHKFLVSGINAYGQVQPQEYIIPLECR